MGELERRIINAPGANLPVIGGNRELKGMVRRVYAQTVEARMQVDGAYKIAGRMMENLVELDHYRRELAHDELTNNLCAQIEMECLETYRRIQRRLYED